MIIGTKLCSSSQAHDSLPKTSRCRKRSLRIEFPAFRSECCEQEGARQGKAQGIQGSREPSRPQDLTEGQAACLIRPRSGVNVAAIMEHR